MKVAVSGAAGRVGAITVGRCGEMGCPVGFDVAVQRDPAGVLTVATRGELDYHTVGAFRDAVARAVAARPAGLRLDLAGLTFMDSSGLVALLAAHSAATAQQCPFVVDGVSPWLRARFRMTGLDTALGLEPPPGTGTADSGSSGG